MKEWIYKGRNKMAYLIRNEKDWDDVCECNLTQAFPQTSDEHWQGWKKISFIMKGKQHICKNWGKN